MHFETRDDYVTWATTILFSTSDKTNSNAIGNAFDHANKLADLFFGSNRTAAPALPPAAQFRQPPAIPNKPPPVPGEHVTTTEASGARG